MDQTTSNRWASVCFIPKKEEVSRKGVLGFIIDLLLGKRKIENKEHGFYTIYNDEVLYASEDGFNWYEHESNPSIERNLRRRDCCLWSEHFCDYSTGCGNQFLGGVEGPQEENFDFCPYCGRKIYVNIPV